jgi:cytochrome oxidase Cu insertion factor (SCO1/SenC/PrrC family)
MKFDKISPAFLAQRIGKATKFSKVKKTIVLLTLFSFVILIVLVTAELPLKGEVDFLTQIGVIKLNKMIDAPAFILSDLEGDKWSLDDFKGKFVMLNFWATW